MREIIIDCKPDATVKITTAGYVGASCEQATKHFVEGLGGDVSSHTRTADFYKTESPNVKVTR